MATFSELKQLYTEIKSISDPALDEARRIGNRLGEIWDEASSGRVSQDRIAALRAEVEQLKADRQAYKDAFMAGDWVGKQEQLRQGILTLEGDERKQLEQLWGIEQAYTPSILKDRKGIIDASLERAESSLAAAAKSVPNTLTPAATAQPNSTAVPTAPPGGGPVEVLTPAQQQNLRGAPAGVTPAPNKSEPAAAGSDTIQAAPVGVVGAGNRKNILHSYASYTYGLSLHLLTIGDYNELVETGTYSPKNVLVASAGRYNEIVSGSSAFARNPSFGEDFYFSNLRMTTVIGMGEHNRSTNAIDISFTLIEPYGLTFLDRLLEASEAVFSSNYLENPYLLQIDFFGMDDNGNVQQPIPNITKRIPIKILAMDIKMGTNGAEYQIAAMPFNHQAFTESMTNTPINLEITAGTVNGFFKATASGANDLAKKINEAGGERTSRGVIVGPDGQETVAPLALFSPTRIAEYNKEYSKDQVYTAKSYADALNAYKIQQELKQVVLFSDRYDFKFDSRIGDSPLFADEKSVSPNELKMSDVSTYPGIISGNDGTANAALNLKQRKFPIRQGSSIESVVHQMVKNSQYFTSQINIREYKSAEEYNIEKDSKDDRSLSWIKIVPSIKLIGFDPFTNSFAKEITYNVLPYEMRNIRFDEAPQGKYGIEDAKKFYNYMYTGENNDIIDLNIEFNAMYYTAKTTYRSNLLRIYGVDGYYNNVTADGSGTCDVAPPAPRTITPNQTKYRHTDKRHISAGGSKTAQEIAAADLLASMATMAQADMLSIDLKIIGDPDFIKQDDIFYKPAFNANGEIELASRAITPNGSIASDTQEIIVNLEFKTPTDINDADGLMKFDTRYKASGFSGLYRVLIVDNQFEGGKFTQTLTLSRLPNQDDENDKDSMKQRDDTKGWTDQGATNNPPVNQVPNPPAPADSANIPTNTGIVLPPGSGNKLPFQDAVRGTTFPVDAVSNPFARLPSAPTDNSLNAGRTVLGGGG